MFQEEAQERLREHPDKAVKRSTEDISEGSRSSDNTHQHAPSVGPQPFQVIDPQSDIMLMVGLETITHRYIQLQKEKGRPEEDVRKELENALNWFNVKNV